MDEEIRDDQVHKSRRRWDKYQIGTCRKDSQNHGFIDIRSDDCYAISQIESFEMSKNSFIDQKLINGDAVKIKTNKIDVEVRRNISYPNYLNNVRDQISNRVVKDADDELFSWLLVAGRSEDNMERQDFIS